MNPHTSLTLKTSGSSGTSRAILLDRTSVFLNAAHGERERHRMTEAIGKRYGYREAVIVLSPDREESSTPRVQRYLREHAFLPPGMTIERLYIDATEAPERYLSRLNAFAPDMIQGYGSSIEALCDHVNKAGVEFHHPRAMYFHSDGISERTRTILRARSIPVFSTYESCEALKIGFECQAHVELPSGRPGRLVAGPLSVRTYAAKTAVENGRAGGEHSVAVGPDGESQRNLPAVYR